MSQSIRIKDYALILNEAGAVLTLPDGSLPMIASSHMHFWQSALEITTGMRQQFELDTVVLRCALNWFHEDVIHNIYLLDLLNPSSPACQWLPLETANLTPFSRNQIESVWRWLQTDHALRVPWYRTGWFQQQFAALRFATGRIQQIRSWQRSSILRVPTATGDIYLKTVPVMFAHERSVTRWLSQRFPDNIPLEAAQAGTDIWLLEDYRGEPLSAHHATDVWVTAVRRYAEMQVQLAAASDELVAAGCPYRDLDWLAQGIAGLLSDEAALQVGYSPFTLTEINQLQTLIPRFQAMCAELAGYGIPLTLEHGDLWSGQIIIRGTNTPIFTDWSDCAITHPCFSLPFFLKDIEISGAEAALTAAYGESKKSSYDVS